MKVTFHEAVAEFKRELIRETLRRHGGNLTHAAAALGLQRTHLYVVMRRLGVERGRVASRRGKVERKEVIA